MRIKTYIATALLTGLLVGTAPSALAQQELKVGFVNIQKVFSNAPQAAAAEESIQTEFKKRQEEIKKLQQEILSLREKLGREGLTMGDEERGELEDQLLRKDRKFRWEQQIYDEDLKIRRNEVLGEVQDEIVKAIYKIGQNEKYDLILTDGVIYSDSRVNLTDRVVELLKERAE